MTLEGAINILRCRADGDAPEALEVVIRAAEKSNKYRKKAKRFKRKWLGLRQAVRDLRDDIIISMRNDDYMIDGSDVIRSIDECLEED